MGSFRFGAIGGGAENLGSLQPRIATCFPNGKTLAHKSKGDVVPSRPYRRFQQGSLDSVALRMATSKLVESAAFGEKLVDDQLIITACEMYEASAHR